MKKLNASAKLNLSLRILGKRPDGFHELDMIMAPVEGLADSLTFADAEAYQLSCDDTTVPVDEENLVTQAVRAMEAELGQTYKGKIYLEKRIPHGAGLGGGSSDAAITLKALNEHFGNRLSLEKLHAIAAELGSDVPFFLYDAVCRCRGRGEQIEVMREFPALKYFLMKPEFGVSTPEAYGAWSSSQELPGINYAPQAYRGGALVNDLERPVFEKYRFLPEAKLWLLAQPEVDVAMMSGSGSTLFAVLKEGESGEALPQRAKEELDPSLWTWVSPN